MHQLSSSAARAGNLEAEAVAPPLAAARSGTTTAEPALEPGAFNELVQEIGLDGAGEVRAVFWADTVARLKLFDGLALAEHRARIEREAHSLKSAARTFGYLRLAALALRLENSAAILSEAEYRTLLDGMDAAYAAALACEPQR
jgi:HPt (histidine-containing phosphotransfer) domain-containing protein